MSTRDYSIAAVAFLFSVPALGGSLFGFDIGATSYVISQLTTTAAMSDPPRWETTQKSPLWQGAIVSTASFGALLGSALILPIADRIGRKRELQLGATLYIIASIIQSQAAYVPSEWALGTLFVGRLTYGVGIGITMHAAPTYLAENSPSRIRGFLISLKEAAIVLGILLGFGVGYICTTKDGTMGWMKTYSSSLVLSISMLVLSVGIPRSCRWLLLQGKTEEARKAMSFFMLEDHVDEEFVRMQTLHEHDQQSKYDTSDIQLWDKQYRLPLTAGVGLVILQQVTGQPSILSYAAPIFAQSGLSDWSSVLVASFKFVATMCAVVTVERFGRKKLLQLGCTLMLLALIVLMLTFGNSSSGSGSTVHTWVIMISMFVYIAGYQVGFGPISWLIIGEVFPLRVRAAAVSVAVQVNFLCNAVVQFLVPVLQKVVGLNVTFGIFAALTACSMLFVRKHVPETKGLTLEMINDEFEKMRGVESRQQTYVDDPNVSLLHGNP